jgi:hypothetical protein
MIETDEFPQEKSNGSGQAVSSDRATAMDPAGLVIRGSKGLPRAGLIMFALMACVTPLVYVLYTNHVWEDFFITFRHSRNLCEGQGLVYNPGERVHGFTSPLGVLLPALCYLVTGQVSYVPALWLFRVLSILAFVGGGVLLLKSFSQDEDGRGLAKLFFGVLYVFNVQAVAFSVNGMETAFMLLFLGWGIYLFARGLPEHWVAGGICWAGLMWTRPDSVVYITALALVNLVFCRGPRKPMVFSLVKSAGVCTVLYLPWFIWAWIYYGSPVPHTIIAKMDLSVGLLGQLRNYLQGFPERYLAVAAEAFRPIEYDGDDWLPLDGWGWTIPTLTKYLGIFCATYWLVPIRDRLGRAASLCYAVLCLYLEYMLIVYPWYLPPVKIFGLIVLARGIITLAEVVGKLFPHDEIYRQSGKIALVLLALVCLFEMCLFGLITWQMKIQEQVVEMGNRARVGLWLRAHIRPGDSVYLEPLGYIGYFSNARMVDWPGLVSPEVVRLRKERRLGLEDVPPSILPDLRPDWIILRPQDVEFSLGDEYFRRNYALVRVFEVTAELEQYVFLPGRNYLMFDASFSLFKRVSADSDQPAYREVSVPPEPIGLNEMSWKDRTGRGEGGGGYMVFALPKAQRVAAIRLTYSYEHAAESPALRVSWRRSDRNEFAEEERSFLRQEKNDPGERTLLIWVDDRIDQIRINPDTEPCVFKLSEITLLVRASARARSASSSRVGAAGE